MYMLQTYFFVYLVKKNLNASDLAVPKYFFKNLQKMICSDFILIVKTKKHIWKLVFISD